MTSYQPADGRYDTMRYRRVGRSGLLLRHLLGLCRTLGGDRRSRLAAIVRRAFDLGITHFDLATPLAAHGSPRRISAVSPPTCAATGTSCDLDQGGYDMWPGPYGDHGSRKPLLSSLDQPGPHGAPYVDIFYPTVSTGHAPKRLWGRWTRRAPGQGAHAGISSYSERTKEAA
jgi:L-glyceraldehyde 3-phosphate reductase